MASNAQIISDLRLVMETGHDLELMNTYKGVPFICRGKVASIDGNRVIVKTHDPALICLLNEQQTKVLGSDYFEPSIAQVDSIDLAAGTVTLTNLSYLGTKLGERMIVRVEPKEPIQVTIEGDGRRISGALADISVSGLGVIIQQSNYSTFLKPGTALHINMQLPNGAVSMSGTVLSSVRLEDTSRLSVRFVQDDQHKLIIFRYLIDRRAEIEQELKGIYEQTLRDLHTGD